MSSPWWSGQASSAGTRSWAARGGLVRRGRAAASDRTVMPVSAGLQVMPERPEQLRQRLPYETVASSGGGTRNNLRGADAGAAVYRSRVSGATFAYERKTTSEEIWRMGQWQSILRQASSKGSCS